jgi:hypothetical protein
MRLRARGTTVQIVTAFAGHTDFPREGSMRGAKRIMLLMAIGIVGVALTPPAVGAPPLGGCPPANPSAVGWERVTVQSLIDAGLILAGAQGVDINGNGFTCVTFPPGRGAPEGIPTIRDDTVPPTSP